MRRRAGRVVAMGCLVIATCLVGGLGVAPVGADPTMTITPDTGLVDGQAVTVAVTGLTPLSVAGVAQCVEGHGQDGCDLENRQIISTDENGGFTTSMVVHTMLATPLGAIDCRTSADACVIGASTTFDEIGAVWTSMEFDPTGALQPAPNLTAQPGTDLVDNQQINVVGSGYPPNIGYSVQVCPTGGTLATDCALTQFPTVVFTGPSGTFTQPVQVHSGFVTEAGDFIDCRTAPGACEVRIGPNPRTNRTGVAPLSFDPAGPLTPRPSMVIDPAADLVDRQTVHATVNGFGPQGQIQIQQCVTDPFLNCEPVGFGLADTTGVLAIDVEVDARLWFGTDPGPDCRVTQCQLRASSFNTADVAIVDLSFDPDAPFAPPPQLGADPTTGLVDHDIIEVSGSGFSLGYGFITTPIGPAHAAAASKFGRALQDVVVAPSQTVTSAMMCVRGGSSYDDCDYNTGQYLPLTAEGDVAGPFQVSAILDTYSGTVDCRDAVPGCELRAGLIGHPYKQAILPLSFEPDGALAPPPTITISPTTDLVDGQTVHVTGDGLPINRAVGVVQCEAGPQFPEGCYGGLTGASADGSGHAEFDVTVQRMLSSGFLAPTDCAASQDRCQLVVLNQNYTPIDHVVINFRALVDPPPTDPPAPPPTSDPPPTSTTAPNAEVLPAVETRPLFTG